MSPNKFTSGALAERSPNAFSPTKSASSKEVALEKATMPVFEAPSTQQAQRGGQVYVSPSDAIRSPTTKKLGEIKGRRFA
jgi:hypothetical protein